MTKSRGIRRTTPRLPLQARFDLNVLERPETGCWPWSGSLMNSGYGQISTGSRARGNYVNHLAHRLAYTLHVGPIPQGLEIEHTCENKRCVRWTVDPSRGEPHLAAVMHAENMKRSEGRIGWNEMWRRRRSA